MDGKPTQKQAAMEREVDCSVVQREMVSMVEPQEVEQATGNWRGGERERGNGERDG